MNNLPTEDRTFIVTAKFKINGDLPSRLKEEQLEGYIAEEINTHIALCIHGELFGDYDEEWEAYIADEQSISVDVEEFSISYSSEPFCESCGENHTDFAATISTGTGHCVHCAESLDLINEAEADKIRIIEKRLKKEYYQRKLKELD